LTCGALIALYRKNTPIDYQAVSSEELVEKLGIAVILAELNAGKTRLLQRLWEQLRVTDYRVSIFRHKKIGGCN